MATKEENPKDDIVTPETKGEYEIVTPEKSLFYLEMEFRDKGEEVKKNLCNIVQGLYLP